VARLTFQEAVIAMVKKEMGSSSKLSIPEKTRGNILLKAWDRNISESKECAKKVRNSCEETFILIDESLLSLDNESSVGTLGQIDITKHLLNIKENEEKEWVEISQINQTNIVQVDKWLIKPSIQLCSIIAKD
jgi:hypothetical protein